MALKKREEWKLSECETLIMKVIWDAEEDICIHDIWETMRVRYDKEYVIQTIRTFLFELSKKGFVTTHRKGRISYAHALKSEKEYREMLLKEEVKFWHKGRPGLMVTALSDVVQFSKEDAEEIRRIIDAMDD